MLSNESKTFFPISRLYIPTVKQKQSHIKKYLCFIWSPKLLANYVLFSFQTYLIINNIVFWILPIAFKVYKDFLCLKVFVISFSEPISSLLLYHWIQFCNARKNFHVQLWFIFAQKRIQTAGLSKYFVNYTKYIMACTLRSKSLCSRIWIVIPRQ